MLCLKLTRRNLRHKLLPAAWVDRRRQDCCTHRVPRDDGCQETEKRVYRLNPYYQPST